MRERLGKDGARRGVYGVHASKLSESLKGNEMCSVRTAQN